MALLDALGAGTGAGQGTFAYSITPVGAITGNYFDASNVDHGYLRTRGGTFTTFEVPEACSACAGHGTFAGNINPMGTIAGTYFDPSFVFHGFVRAPDGTITTFDAPGADTTAFDFNATFHASINPSAIPSYPEREMDDSALVPLLAGPECDANLVKHVCAEMPGPGRM